MAIVEGLLFGFVLQLSIGPVCLSVWQRSLTAGFWQAWLMILGVATVDAAYMMAALWGIGRFLENPVVGAALIVYGIILLGRGLVL
ncbi:LysE family translocator [Brevibacillus ruminantium]|uniref:LysE family translocator n=1 Tax=Brevibacillus ruminantium TaxID=2950604 RepID=A0ABY4WIS9_9BACL|nr:LysE family transporter [Brevibacillus ruminantium]USG67055.1 LysE family translocator [Brevibacillus ruminantium]